MALRGTRGRSIYLPFETSQTQETEEPRPPACLISQATPRCQVMRQVRDFENRLEPVPGGGKILRFGVFFPFRIGVLCMDRFVRYS